MSTIILKAENISKQYRLGLVGSGTLRDDFTRFWHRIRGKDDPFLKVGEVNDRSAKNTGDYVWALKDINFEVKQGEVLGIIGKNGAGKSTLLKILSRVTAPTTGVIKSRGRIASLLEVGTGFHPELTGRENIYLNGAILGMTKAEINSKFDEIVDFSGCERYIDTPTKRYSSGMTVRLAFAVAAHLEPEILVVDEVLAVGDAEFQKKAIGKMQDISKGEGRTVLFVSHNMATIQNLCNRVILLDRGKNIQEGSANEVVTSYISGVSSNLELEVFITSKHRRFETSPFLKLNKISLNNEDNYVRQELNFKINFSLTKNINQKISCTGSVCALDDTRIGSFFSNPFVPKIGVNEITLAIPNHNLSPGIYYLNISISNGSLEEDNLRMLDHAYESIKFRIVKEKKDSINLTEWNSSWGKIFLQSQTILNE